MIIVVKEGGSVNSFWAGKADKTIKVQFHTKNLGKPMQTLSKYGSNPQFYKPGCRRRRLNAGVIRESGTGRDEKVPALYR